MGQSIRVPLADHLRYCILPCRRINNREIPMSVLRTVIRMCAVAACRDRTWAEGRVYDSDNTPLLDALSEQAQPYITVFTDTDTVQNIEGRDLYTGERRLQLVFEFGIAAAAKVVDNENDELDIPQTDQGMEALVDILEGQIIAAVLTDPDSPFGELLRQMINKIERAPSTRGGSEDRQTRWAARQLILVCDTISPPAPGVVLPSTHLIKQFISLIRLPENANLQMSQAGDLIEKVLTITAYPDWKQGQAWLALTKAGIHGTGITPMPEGDLTGHEVTDTLIHDEDLD